MTDHIDTAAERAKLTAVLSETYLRCESCNDDMNCHDPSVMWLHRGKPICDNCADESEIPAEELDSAPDPVRVAARLLDVLDAQDAVIERLRATLSAITATDCYSRDECTAMARAALNGEDET